MLCNCKRKQVQVLCDTGSAILCEHAGPIADDGEGGYGLDEGDEVLPALGDSSDEEEEDSGSELVAAPPPPPPPLPPSV